jgi:uncharacterized membrane protein YgdD (TMEM256/DUF423 family)
MSVVFSRVALVIGLGIIASVTHTTIVTTGGYSQPQVPMIVAVAFGICCGSVAVQKALKTKATRLACMIGLALFAGEVFALATSAERVIVARDTASQPSRVAQETRNQASKRVATAEKAKATADTAVIEKSATKDCRKNCAQLLSDAVAEANDELTEARKAYNNLPTKQLSVSPLADILKIEASTLDLILACLFSISGMGLGSSLICFSTSANTKSDREIIASFMLDTCKKSSGSSVKQTQIESAFTKWCLNNGLVPMKYEAFSAQLVALLTLANINVTNSGEIIGIALK